MHAMIIGVAINEIILVINHDGLKHCFYITELFPHNIGIISNILKIRVIHYICIGIGEV